MATKAKVATKPKLVRAVFYLEPPQLEGLRAEAARRMAARGAGRMDASEVLRDALDVLQSRRALWEELKRKG
jgi:hypothetical protein